MDDQLPLEPEDAYLNGATFCGSVFLTDVPDTEPVEDEDSPAS